MEPITESSSEVSRRKAIATAMTDTVFFFMVISRGNSNLEVVAYGAGAAHRADGDADAEEAAEHGPHHGRDGSRPEEPGGEAAHHAVSRSV